MDALNEIIARLEQQRQAIEAALVALRGGVEPAPTAPRVKRTYTRRAVKDAPVKAAKAVKKTGGISAEGRQKLAEAMARRWAAKRAAASAKKAPAKAPKKDKAAKKAE